MTFVDPSPALYAYLFLQSFLFVPVVALLATLRALIATGPARLWALAAMALSGAAMFLQFGPALMGLFEGWLPVFAGQATRWGAGLVLPLLPSAALLISARASGRRWWGIDLVHLMAVAALLGLFGWSRWV